MLSPQTIAEISTYSRLAKRMGVWGPLTLAGAGTVGGIYLAANDATHQKRGEQLSTFAGRGVAIAGKSVSMAALSMGLSMIPGIGPVTRGALIVAASLYPNARMANSASRSFRKLSELGLRVHRLEMGGRYEDSQSARAARMAAVQQMNATMVASRRWLGSEAQILHR